MENNVIDFIVKYNQKRDKPLENVEGLRRMNRVHSMTGKQIPSLLKSPFAHRPTGLRARMLANL